MKVLLVIPIIYFVLIFINIVIDVLGLALEGYSEKTIINEVERALKRIVHITAMILTIPLKLMLILFRLIFKEIRYIFRKERKGKIE